MSADYHCEKLPDTNNEVTKKMIDQDYIIIIDE